MATFTLNEDQKRRSNYVLDELAALGVCPERPINAAIVIIVSSGVITTVDLAQSVTTKTLSGSADMADGNDWTVTS